MTGFLGWKTDMEFEEWYDTLTEQDKLTLLREVWDGWARNCDARVPAIGIFTGPPEVSTDPEDAKT